MKHELRSERIEIGPLPVDLIASFHRALDCVAKERRYLTFLEAPSLESTRAFVLDGQTQGDPRLVAVSEGEVVGWCDVSRHRRPAHAHRGTLGMAIVPRFRGRGLGLQLITATLERTWAADFTRVELSVYSDNARAIALYDRVGFVREGLTRDAACIDGTYRDAIAMALLRRPASPS